MGGVCVYVCVCVWTYLVIFPDSGTGGHGAGVGDWGLDVSFSGLCVCVCGWVNGWVRFCRMTLIFFELTSSSSFCETDTHTDTHTHPHPHPHPYLQLRQQSECLLRLIRLPTSKYSRAIADLRHLHPHLIHHLQTQEGFFPLPSPGKGLHEGAEGNVVGLEAGFFYHVCEDG